MATLSAITVVGSPSGLGYLAAGAKPKRAPPPRRRAPRRAVPKQPARPRRRSPSRTAPARPPRVRPTSITKQALRKFTLGRLIDAGELVGNAMFRGLERLGGGPLVQRASTPPADLPFVRAMGRESLIAAPEFPQLAPQTVTGRNSLAASPNASTYRGPYDFTPKGAPSPWEDIAKKGTGYKVKKRSPPLTRKKEPGVKSKPGDLSIPEIGPQPKAKRQRDPCKPKKRDPSQCPKSGYRRRCIEWEKVKCQ